MSGTLGILPWTLAGCPGIGTSRERTAWLEGGWDPGRRILAAERAGWDTRTRDRVEAFGAQLDDAVARRDVLWLHDALPTRERWRVLPLVIESALALDIETAGDEVVVVGVRNREHAWSWYQGGSVEVQELIESAPALLTFNGGAFDLPILERAWKLRRPRIHVDVVQLARRLSLAGGLKSAEQRVGWQRPPHLDGVRGGDAVPLWWRWKNDGDRAALAMLLEYNLEDVFSLAYLAAWCHDTLVGKIQRSIPGMPDVAPLVAPWMTREQGGPTILKALAAALPPC